MQADKKKEDKEQVPAAAKRWRIRKKGKDNKRHSAVAEEPHSAVAEAPMEKERNLQIWCDICCSGFCLPTCPTLIKEKVHPCGICGKWCDSERCAKELLHNSTRTQLEDELVLNRDLYLTLSGGAFGDYQPPDGNGEGPRAVESDPRARNVVLKEAREKLKRLVVDTERVEAVTAVMKLLNEYGRSPLPFIQLGQGLQDRWFRGAPK